MIYAYRSDSQVAIQTAHKVADNNQKEIYVVRSEFKSGEQYAIVDLPEVISDIQRSYYYARPRPLERTRSPRGKNKNGENATLQSEVRHLKDNYIA